MSQWPMAEFVSRVAERVTSAGEEFAGLIDRNSDELLLIGGDHLRDALAPVEPSPEFVAALRLRLQEAPLVEDPELSRHLDRRVVYGVAVGSLASAAVAAAIILRYRNVQRAA